jgi:hypothetical protein
MDGVEQNAPATMKRPPLLLLILQVMCLASRISPSVIAVEYPELRWAWRLKSAATVELI